MSTYTTPPPTSSHDRTEADKQRTELSELRGKIARKYDLVLDDDPELYEEAKDWLQQSAATRDGSVGQAVNSQLRELKRGNKMRDHRGVDDPTDAFPDACEGCPHYGVACPMIKRNSVTKTRKRYIRNAESDEELVNNLSELAIDWDCHVVLEVLDDYQTSYGEFLQQGYDLLSRLTETIAGRSTDTDRDTTPVDHGPSPEDRQQMEETIAAVMGDDEDGDGP